MTRVYERENDFVLVTVSRFINILKYLFSKKYRSLIKQIRLDCHLAILREMFPRVNCSYSEMLKNGY